MIITEHNSGILSELSIINLVLMFKSQTSTAEVLFSLVYYFAFYLHSISFDILSPSHSLSRDISSLVHIQILLIIILNNLIS